MERIQPNKSSGDKPAPARPVSGSSGRVVPSLSSKVLVIVLVVAALIIAGSLALQALSGGGVKVKGDQYQAVFLTNGQVYFGKISGIKNEYVKLNDIYYLQVTQQQNEEGIQPAEDQQTPQISLQKLGNELHGPESEMFISKDHILFWENLKDEGDVVTAIKQFNEQQQNQEEDGGNNESDDEDN